MTGIHDVDSTEFQYGDYNVEIKLSYWERMPTQNGEAYEVMMYARHQHKDSIVTHQKTAPVRESGGWFGEETETDVTELVRKGWQGGRQKLDKVTRRISGSVTVDFEAAAEGAKESSE